MVIASSDFWEYLSPLSDFGASSSPLFLAPADGSDDSAAFTEEMKVIDDLVTSVSSSLIIGLSRPLLKKLGLIHRDGAVFSVATVGAGGVQVNSHHRSLSSKRNLVSLGEVLRHHPPRRILLFRVLESLDDPRPLLKLIRRFKRAELETEVLIASRVMNDADDEKSGETIYGHQRRWKLHELRNFLQANGFRVDSEHPYFSDDGNTLAGSVFKSVDASHLLPLGDEGWLSGINLHARSLIVTTELAGETAVSGGIGSFVRNQIEASSPLTHHSLVVGSEPAAWGQLEIGDKSTFATRLGANPIPIKKHRYLNPSQDEIVWHVCDALISVMDNLRIVEVQDYLGPGYRISQAAESGLLPDDVRVLCWVHGHSHYLDAGRSDSFSYRPERYFRERVTIESSDLTWFPSHFLLDMTEQQLRITPNRKTVAALPVQYSTPSDAGAPPERPKKLIYVGKASAMKGYPDILEFLRELREKHSGLLSEDLQVSLYGISHLPQGFAETMTPWVITAGKLAHADLMEEISVSAGAIGLVPYRGDNAPMVVNEYAIHGIEALCFDRGGIPEMFPKELAQEILCAPSAQALVELLLRRISLPVSERASILSRTQAFQEKRFAKSREKYQDLLERPFVRPSASNIESITLAIINLGGPQDWFEDIAVLLKNSPVLPAEVLVVNNGNKQEHCGFLNDWASALGVPIRILYQEEDVGRSGARNTALNHCETPLLVVQDSSDALHPQALNLFQSAMALNPGAAAVLPWSIDFVQNSLDSHLVFPHGGRATAGQDLGQGLARNVFGGSVGCFRVAEIKDVGGWKGGKLSAWEDWALYLELTIAGKEIVTQPQILFARRLQQSSESQNSNGDIGFQTLSESLSGHLPPKYVHGLLAASFYRNRPRADGKTLEKTISRLALMKKTLPPKITSAWRKVRRRIREILS